MASSSLTVYETLMDNDSICSETRWEITMLLSVTYTQPFSPLYPPKQRLITDQSPIQCTNTHTLVSSYQCGHISLSAAPVRAHEEGRNQDRVDTAQFKSEATLQLWRRRQINNRFRFTHEIQWTRKNQCQAQTWTFSFPLLNPEL